MRPASPTLPYSPLPLLSSPPFYLLRSCPAWGSNCGRGWVCVSGEIPRKASGGINYFLWPQWFFLSKTCPVVTFLNSIGSNGSGSGFRTKGARSPQVRPCITRPHVIDIHWRRKILCADWTYNICSLREGGITRKLMETAVTVIHRWRHCNYERKNRWRFQRLWTPVYRTFPCWWV